MINFKKLFWPNPHLLPVSKTEKEILECFVLHKKEFEQWLLLHPQPRIRFQFYFPAAVDFYFDNFRLFTAFFKRDAFYQPELSELKMSKENYLSIRTASWKPFEEVMLQFLSLVEESSKATQFTKKRSLYEYASICEKGKETTAPVYGQPLETPILTN